MTPALATLDRVFFRGLNQLVEPLVRAGIGSPGIFPTGVVILEAAGRKTGWPLSMPLLGTLLGDLTVVSTVRSGSQWMRNVAERPQVRYWVLGRPREATAVVVAPGLDTADALDTAPAVRCLASALRPWTHILGMSFAILAPASEDLRAAGRTGAGVPGVRGEPDENLRAAGRTGAGANGVA